MQLSTLLTLTTSLALTSTTLAAPTLRSRDTSTLTITLKGAADAAYTISIPRDGAEHATNNVLSISSVYSNDINVAQYCSLQTVDYPPALVAISEHEWNVGPPQTVNTVKCWGGNDGGNGGGQVPVVHVEFQGADPSEGAKYGLDVKLDGTVFYTNNKLSISTIYTTYQGLPGCTFKYADHDAALSKIRDNTWAVGPPQWIESISCRQ